MEALLNLVCAESALGLETIAEAEHVVKWVEAAEGTVGRPLEGSHMEQADPLLGVQEEPYNHSAHGLGAALEL